MKLIKVFCLLLSLLLLATFCVACKKDVKKDKLQSNSSIEESQGYDEITFGDEDEEDDDIVIDFETGSVISSGSDDSDDGEDTPSGNNSSSSDPSVSNNSGNSNSSSDSVDFGNSDSDNKQDTGSKPDQGEMEGYSPWKDSSLKF